MARSERIYLWTGPFFRKVVADRVRFALTRYFSRKAQIADIPCTPDMLNTGFPVPRDFALAFYTENLLKPGESRKIKLKINGKQYDTLFQRPRPARKGLIIYGKATSYSLCKMTLNSLEFSGWMEPAEMRLTSIFFIV